MFRLQNFIDELCAAAEDDDPQRMKSALNAFCDALPVETGTIEAEKARAVLGCLRKHRRFSGMLRACEAIIVDGCDDAQVRRQYGQALIETGAHTAAIAILERLMEDKEIDPAERADASGVCGRAWKDIAVTARGSREQIARDAIARSYDCYASIYRDDPGALYQGINSVALAAWDRGLALSPDEQKQAKDDAGEIHLRVAQSLDEAMADGSERFAGMQKLPLWDLAIAGEALVALGRYDEATEWFTAYVNHKKLGAFELGGTVRQLADLWGLGRDNDDEGARLLAPLTAKLLQLPGGYVSLTDDAIRHLESVPKAAFERVFGDQGPMTWTYLQHAIEAAKSVVLITEHVSGRGIGTGFVVKGSDLSDRLGDKLYILTNAHVVSDPPELDALAPPDALVKFELADNDSLREGVAIKRIVWQSSVHDHDACLIELDVDISEMTEPVRMDPRLPILDGDKRAGVFVIGHPNGGEISFSFQDNELLDYERAMIDAKDDSSPCRVHYRTPTKPGSSGSPVFNLNWNAIALHHAGTETMKRLNGEPGHYAANEGIWIQSIKRAIP